MTNEMRERVLANIERSNGNLTIEFAREAIVCKEKSIEFHKSNRRGLGKSSQHIVTLESEMAYFEAVY